ncbi:MAG: hypothetical protein GX230_04495 [Lentisphaerae bacterium]|nr:hypothetical protein [Lentisphaerota bacterium]
MLKRLYDGTSPGRVSYVTRPLAILTSNSTGVYATLSPPRYLKINTVALGAGSS